MPLNWLGQLSPTMQQQIALQRALLALQREDEQIRSTTPALARGLEGGTTPGAVASGGPTATRGAREPAFKGGIEYSPITTSFRPGAGSLEEALRAAQPTEGYVSGEERARLYKEKMYEGREVGAKEAFDKISTLDPAGQKVALNALRKFKPAVYKAMETEGYMSPSGALVEPKKKPLNVSTWTDEDGWLNQTTVYEDGTTETEIIGRGEKEPVEGATISDIATAEKLGMETQEFAERHRNQAIKVMGSMPRPGIDTITVEGEDVLATAEHANAWLEGVIALTAFFAGEAGEAPPEGEPTMEGVKAMYEGRPDLISDIQQNLGIPVTGVWDEETDRQFYLYGPTLEGEPTTEGEVKPKFERQKKFWTDWTKKWGKTFTGVTKAIKGVM